MKSWVLFLVLLKRLIVGTNETASIERFYNLNLYFGQKKQILIPVIPNLTKQNGFCRDLNYMGVLAG